MTRVFFPIIGMHCASCARLIERSLTKIPGVSSAAVNYGSEQATIEYGSPANPGTLVKVIEKTGYKVGVADKKAEINDLKIKMIVSAVLSGLIMLGSFTSLPLISNFYFLFITFTCTI